MDEKELRVAGLIGRKVWVEGVISEVADERGNVDVMISSSVANEENPFFVVVSAHASSIVRLLEPELKIGDTVRWKVDNSGVLVKPEGEVLWQDGEWALVRWEHFDQPELVARAELVTVSGST